MLVAKHAGGATCDEARAQLNIPLATERFGGTLPPGVENHRFTQQVFASLERVDSPVVSLDAGSYLLASSAAAHRG